MMKKRLLALLLFLTVILSLVSCEIPRPGVDQPPISSCDHVDGNRDGLCDTCLVSVVVTLDLYAINDLHGKLRDSDTQPGVEELTTYLYREMQNDAYPILFSVGDMWQGSAESNLTRGKLVTEWMNEMGFVSMTLGNHEFDWGEEYIEENADLAEFPLLAINVIDRDTNERVSYCEASVVVEAAGLEIGIIGAIGDCYSSIASDHSGGVRFATGTALSSLVAQEARRLRDGGVDVIIYTIHDGYEESVSGERYLDNAAFSAYYDVAALSEYVDIVFEGHTHQSYVIEDSAGDYHLQGGGDNRGISHVQLSVNVVNGDTYPVTREIVSAARYQREEAHPLLDTLATRYEQELAGAYRTLGMNNSYRSSYEIRDIVSMLYYQFAISEWGDDYDIVLGGGFLTVRSPGHLNAGEVVYGELNSLLPFDNQLVLCSMSGYDLERVFFNTTNSNYFYTCGEYGESLRGKIDRNATYYVVTDTYTSTYRYNKMTEIERFAEPYYARDLLADYIEAGGLE